MMKWAQKTARQAIFTRVDTTYTQKESADGGELVKKGKQ
jgi:hypothetical protein